MKLKVLKETEINDKIVEEIVELINENPKCILGLATGSTPLGIYHNLIAAYKSGKVSFKDVKSFNLDEYLDLPLDNEQSYYTFMHRNLFDKIDIKKENTYFPKGKTNEELAKYDDLIANFGGIDFQILGIGSDGHIAFNEPFTSFNSKTHIATLKDSTRIDNSRFFACLEEVPKRAMTMGLDTIMHAKRIVLIALGKNKSQAIKSLINDEMNEKLPASILKRHPNVTIYCDEDAASDL